MEFWDICNQEGEPTGKMVLKGQALQAGEYHIAVEAWIINSRKEFLIQRRSYLCTHYPGIWSLTAGRIQAGEDSAAGCIREVEEEIGLSLRPEELEHFARVNRNDGSHMIWDVFVIQKDRRLEEFVLDPLEVAEVKWVSGAELEQMIREQEIFVYPEMLEFFKKIEEDYC